MVLHLGTNDLVGPPSVRGQFVTLACSSLELLLIAGSLALMLTVNVWAGIALMVLAVTYAVVVIPCVRTRLGFHRWRGGWER
jgi:hypothetical protein